MTFENYSFVTMREEAEQKAASSDIYENRAAREEATTVLALPQPNRIGSLVHVDEEDIPSPLDDDYEHFSVITRGSSSVSSTHFTAFSIISSVSIDDPTLTATSPGYSKVTLHWSLESVIRPDSPASMYRYRKHLSRKKALQLAAATQKHNSTLPETNDSYSSLAHHQHNISPQLFACEFVGSQAIQEEDEEAADYFFDDNEDGPEGGEVSPLVSVVSKTIRLPVVLASNMIFFLFNQISPSPVASSESVSPPPPQ